jgi:hypothetical protein
VGLVVTVGTGAPLGLAEAPAYCAGTATLGCLKLGPTLHAVRATAANSVTAYLGVRINEPPCRRLSSPAKTER